MKAYTYEQINAVLDQKPNVIDTVTFDRTRFEAWYIEQGKRDEKRDLSLPYKTDSGTLVKFREDGTAFGLSYDGLWIDHSYWTKLTERSANGSYYWQPATVEEWEDMLIKQAEKRGYKNGNYTSLVGRTNKHHAGFEVDGYGNVWTLENNGSGQNQVFNKSTGKWAEIIEHPTVDLVSAVQMIAEKLEMNIKVQ